MRACGKGSYGRLGLGDSNNQSTLKKLTFEPHRSIKKVSSSKGSDGHTLAFTTEGEVFSWGDGDYGKLGHGNSSTQKYPKLIQGPLQGKVCAFFVNLQIIRCSGIVIDSIGCVLMYSFLSHLLFITLPYLFVYCFIGYRMPLHVSFNFSSLHVYVGGTGQPLVLFLGQHFTF